jgi:prepilin-type N-terminal cleavage/methylation domain-containing protein
LTRLRFCAVELRIRSKKLFMQILQGREKFWRNLQAGFTLPEAMIAVLLAAVMLVALYGCFASGYSMMRVSREDLRATQIILQRMERLRLCTFDQVKDPKVNPPLVTEYFDPVHQNNGGGGIAYTITYSNSYPPMGTVPLGYRTNMLLVTVNASWISGKNKRNRSMQTYVARDGIEGYVSTGKQ